MPPDARERFLKLLGAAVKEGGLVKLTLGRHRGADPSLRNLFVRPVELKSGPHLAFVWRHDTRDVTKNHRAADALAEIERRVGGDFLDAHLFTSTQVAQLELAPDGSGSLRCTPAKPAAKGGTPHDRAKVRPIPANAPWLQALGVTNPSGNPREGMKAKFRQIEKFAELLTHLMDGANLPEKRPLSIVDMGCGKGYLTFAVSSLLGARAGVLGVESRPELVELCNRVAMEQGMAPGLSFASGTIADTPLDKLDILIALHACDTATDDALAKGIAAGANLLLVAPCCQKELRPAMIAPPVLAPALRHGIFLERQAEFVTDALRSLLLEWAGYRVKAFEFISTEHTPKNLMIAAVKGGPVHEEAAAARIRDFAAFYGIKHQSLARQVGLPL